MHYNWKYKNRLFHKAPYLDRKKLMTKGKFLKNRFLYPLVKIENFICFCSGNKRSN